MIALDGSQALVADEVRGKLKVLGFDPTTQQVAAWLNRMAREEMPCVEVGDWLGIGAYSLTTRGRTLLGNRFPHNGWRLSHV